MADKITTMNISLPTSYREFIEKRMETGGFCNASEYIRHLIREDSKRAEKERLQELLAEGMAGPATPMTQKDWDDIRARVREAAAQKRRKSA